MPDPDRTGPVEIEAGRPNIRESRCVRCGAVFACAMITGEASCWCAAYPQVMPVPQENAGCCCPACLGELTARSGAAVR
jgi:hypothetical protein